MLPIPILTPGVLEGRGEIVQKELGSSLFFSVFWKINLPENEYEQRATQSIQISGGNFLLKNEFLFLSNGTFQLKNSFIDISKGVWEGTSSYLKWEINLGSPLKGFERVEIGEDGIIFFEAKYSSPSENRINGWLKKVHPI